MILRNRIMTNVVIAACGLMAVSCNKSDGSNPIPGITQALKATDLQATWHSNCSKIEGALFSHEKKQIDLHNDSAVMNTQLYAPTDSNCSTPFVQLDEEGTFQTGGGSPGGNNLQIDVKTVAYKPLTALGAAALNAVSLCGISNWEANKGQEVTAATGNGQCWVKSPRTIYDIYTIEGTTLFIGKGTEREKTSAEKRPTELDRNMPFTKN